MGPRKASRPLAVGNTWPLGDRQIWVQIPAFPLLAACYSSLCLSLGQLNGDTDPSRSGKAEMNALAQQVGLLHYLFSPHRLLARWHRQTSEGALSQDLLLDLASKLL